MLALIWSSCCYFWCTSMTTFTFKLQYMPFVFNRTAACNNILTCTTPTCEDHCNQYRTQISIPNFRVFHTQNADNAETDDVRQWSILFCSIKDRGIEFLVIMWFQTRKLNANKRGRWCNLSEVRQAETFWLSAVFFECFHLFQTLRGFQNVKFCPTVS